MRIPQIKNIKENEFRVYVEVNSVIENLSQEEKIKIPKSLMKGIKEKAANITIPIYLNKELSNQISREALIILTCMATKYLFSYEEKQFLKKNIIKA